MAFSFTPPFLFGWWLSLLFQLRGLRDPGGSDRRRPGLGIAKQAHLALGKWKGHPCLINSFVQGHGQFAPDLRPVIKLENGVAS